MLKKFFAKLVGLEGWPKAKPETAQEKFQREQKRESELAEERRQANLRRTAEQDQKKEGDVGNDVTEDLKRFENEGNLN